MRVRRGSKKTIIMAMTVVLIIIGSGIYELYQLRSEPFVLFHFYNYESTDNGFKDFELPEKGRTLEMVEAAFEDYKIASGKKDIELRITTKIEKGDDPNHRRWKYKYMKPSE